MDAISIERESFKYARQFENLSMDMQFKIKKAVEYGIQLASKQPTAMQSEVVEITDNSIMPFGKFKGKSMVNIPAYYFLWLHDNGCSHAGIKKYILDNLEGLKKEAGKR